MNIRRAIARWLGYGGIEWPKSFINNSKENVSFLCRKCHMKLDGRLAMVERGLHNA